MTVEELAAAVIDACEAEKIDHMVTGAFASSFYGIPRSTKDFGGVMRDVLSKIKPRGQLQRRPFSANSSL